jgi:hypothetical protein
MRKAIYLSIFLWFARRVLRKTKPVSREVVSGSPGNPLPPFGKYAMFLVDHCEEPYYFMYGSKFEVPDDADSRLKLDTLQRLIKFHYSSAQTQAAFNVEILPSEGPEDFVGMYPAWKTYYEQYDKIMTTAYGHVLDIIPSGWFLD